MQETLEGCVAKQHTLILRWKKHTNIYMRKIILKKIPVCETLRKRGQIPLRTRMTGHPY